MPTLLQVMIYTLPVWVMLSTEPIHLGMNWAMPQVRTSLITTPLNTVLNLGDRQ
jgi:hypothetical protein